MTIHELISIFSRFVRRVNDIDVVQMCGLAMASTATKLKTSYEIVYNIYNQQEILKIADDITVTACAEQVAGKFCFYLVSVDLEGDITVTKGTNDTYALPTTPTNNVAIGAFKIVTDASHTFTAGTTAFNATGVTATFYDIDCGLAISCINQAMNEVERNYNFEHMKTRTTSAMVLNDYVLANPFPNYKELTDAYIIDADGRTYPPLKRLDRATAMRRYPYLSDYVDRPRIISTVQTAETTLTPDIAPTFQFLFRPTSDDSYTVDMEAYQFSPNFDGIIYSSNWWTLYASDILLYGALIKISPALKDDDRIPTWNKAYNDVLSALISSEKSRDFAGAELYVEDPYGLRTESVDDRGED